MPSPDVPSETPPGKSSATPLDLPAEANGALGALVTGGAHGIGAATVRALAGRGANVTVADLDAEAGERVAAEVGGRFVRTDVADLDSLRAAAADAERSWGRLDVVHLNAGVSSAGMGVGEDFDPDVYRRVVGANLDGVVYGVHAVLPAMRRTGGGVIVATASLAGLVGFGGDPVYSATKHAVVGLVRSLAEPLLAERVRVHAVCPGFADTAMVAPLREALATLGVPLLTAADVASAVLTAVDDPSTGQAWVVQPGRDPQPYEFRGVPGAGPVGQGAAGAQHVTETLTDSPERAG
jgi:NAD(P)-dependent dehydrogenase (short-subunit alcohol dehydrogenase family)